MDFVQAGLIWQLNVNMVAKVWVRRVLSELLQVGGSLNGCHLLARQPRTKLSNDSKHHLQPRFMNLCRTCASVRVETTLKSILI